MTLVESVIYSGGMKPRIRIYYDDINKKEYVCDAELGTSLTDESWKIRRITKDSSNRTTDIELANGWEYNQVATDLATIEAFSYS